MHPKRTQHKHKKKHRGYAVSGRTGYGVMGFPWYALYYGGGYLTGATPGAIPQGQETDSGSGSGTDSGTASAGDGGGSAGSM